MNRPCRIASVMLVLVTLLGIPAAGEAKDDFIELHPKGERLVSPYMGPYVNLADGSVLAVTADSSLVSKDEGKTWESHPLFADPAKFLAREERALIRTRDGTLVMGFLNEREITRAELSMAFSTDDGKTWSKPVVISRRPLQEGEKYYMARQSYPYVFERRPGELWITTMQGGLRMKLHETDAGKPYTIVAFGDSTTAPRGGVVVYAELLSKELTIPTASTSRCASMPPPCGSWPRKSV